MADADLAAEVNHSSGTYPVVAGWGVINTLGDRFTALGLTNTAYIITDSNVMNLYGRNVQRALQKRGIPAHCFIIPAGRPARVSSWPRASTTGWRD